MRRLALAVLACAVAAGPVAFAALEADARTPTGRRQMLFYSDRRVNAMAAEEFERVKRTEPLVYDHPAYDVLQRVGGRIARASGRQEAWEFVLIDSPVANAFALPGGKVAVYAGLLPILRDEAGLAAVIGHEVGHIMARHATERISQATAQGLLGALIAQGVRRSSNRDEWLTAFGLVSTVGFILPYSRRHEAEADEIGILLMARAGYDPRAAPEVWDRMAAEGGRRPPEFLSTHPDPADRAARLRGLLPRAMEEYDRAPEKHPALPIPHEGLRRGDDPGGTGDPDRMPLAEEDEGFRIRIRF
jgi:predicted Zn-dependent protease